MNQINNKNLIFLSILFISSAILLTIFFFNLQSNGFTRISKFILSPLLFYLIFYLYKDKFLQFEIKNKKNIFFLPLIYFLIITTIEFLKLFNNNYDFFDYGLYANRVQRIAESNYTNALNIALFEGHFTPILFIFKFFSIIVNPFSLLIFNTLIILSSLIPIYYFLKKNFFNKTLIFLIFLIFLFYAPLSFINILGFHPEVALIPLYCWAIYFFIYKNKTLLLLTTFLIICCGEQYLPSLILLYIFFGKRIFSSKELFLIIIFIFLYFVSIFFDIFSLRNSDDVRFIFSSSNPYSYLFSSESLFKVIYDFDWIKKIVFLYLIFLPFFFVFNYKFLFILLFEFSKLLLSTEPYHYSIEGHYLVVILPVIFFGFLYKLSLTNKKYIKKLVLLSLSITVGLSFGHSSIPGTINFWTQWSGGTFHYNQYLKSEMAIEKEKINFYIKSDRRNNIYLTNSAVTVDLIKNHNLNLFKQNDDLFASKFDNSFLILEKPIFFSGAGGHLSTNDDKVFLNNFIQNYDKYNFNKIYEGNYFILYSKVK